MNNLVGHPTVASLFASDTLVSLLAHFALYPERSFYQRELARLTNSNLHLVQRELARLESVGLVTRVPRGRQVDYAIVTSHPAWPPLQDLLLRTEALAIRFARALEPAGDPIALAWIFGSIARGDARPDSDLDLMIIGEVSLRGLSQLELPGTPELGRELNIVTYSPAEFRERIATDNHFVAALLDSPRIWVKGTDDELARLVSGGAASTAQSQEE